MFAHWFTRINLRVTELKTELLGGDYKMFSSLKSAGFIWGTCTSKNWGSKASISKVFAGRQVLSSDWGSYYKSALVL